MQSVQYPYSKKNSLFFLVFLSILIGLSISHLVRFIEAKDTVHWVLILLFDLQLIFLLIYLVIKYAIPALKKKVALEFTSIGIVSYIKDVSIDWADIKDIDIVSGRSSSSLHIKFKWETDHGNSIKIGLQYVEGDDKEIYDAAMAFFEAS